MTDEGGEGRLVALAAKVVGPVQGSVGTARWADQLAGCDLVAPEGHCCAAVCVQHGGAVARLEGPVVGTRAPGRDVGDCCGAGCQGSSV